LFTENADRIKVEVQKIKDKSSGLEVGGRIIILEDVRV
jgi:hypothetical protein